jgi:hypothetical protein
MAYRLALEDGLDDQAAQQQILDEFAETGPRACLASLAPAT